MRLYLAGLALVCAMISTASQADAQNLLRAEEIVRELPGVWAMEVAIPPETTAKLQCQKMAMKISIETGLDGKKVYVSRPLEGSYDHADKDGAARSDIKTGLRGYSILLQYENEDRLDNAGKPVRWHLVMPDRDTFYWHRDDWPETHVTAPSHRCPNPDMIG